MTAQDEEHHAGHFRQWPSTEPPSSDADRIWRAIEMTSDRCAAIEDRNLKLRESLPVMLRDAVTDGIRAAAADKGLRESFWASGMDHVGSAMRQQAGGTIMGILWSACKMLAFGLLVLMVAGPASFKALVLSWWGRP